MSLNDSVPQAVQRFGSFPKKPVVDLGNTLHSSLKHFALFTDGKFHHEEFCTLYNTRF